MSNHIAEHQWRILNLRKKQIFMLLKHTIFAFLIVMTMFLITYLILKIL